MKKLILIILLFLPLNIKALSLECPSIASPNEKIDCHLTDTSAIALIATLNNDAIFTYQNLQTNPPYKIYYQSSKGISLGNIKDETPINSILTFQISPIALSNQEYQISLNDITVSDTTLQLTKLENITSSIKIINDINTLDDIKISSGTLNPKFNKTITQYTLKTTEKNLTITPIKTDELSTLNGNYQDTSLNYGVNEKIIQVTSQRGNTKEYKIYITRYKTQTTNNSTTKQETKKSSDFTLKEIILSTGKINLKKDTYLYEVTVPFATTTLDVKVTPNDNKATLNIDKPETLEVGENPIIITVTAEDGTVATYIIKVTREKQLSNDATLKSLKIKNYQINFNSTTTTYDLLIKDEKKLKITPETNNEFATYQIKGNNNLKNNSIIKIIVTAEDGTTTTYQIKIMKEGETTSVPIPTNYKTIFLIIFIIVLILILLGKIISKIKNKSIRTN